MLLLSLLGACQQTEHIPVEVMLDVDGAQDERATHVRVCVEGGVGAEFGAVLTATYALTGLVADSEPLITVDVLADGVVLQRVGPIAAGDYTVASAEACDGCEPCTGCVLTAPEPGWPLCGSGEAPGPDEPAWTAGVRFAR